MADPENKPPHEHVIVFDEAQRAWDEEFGQRRFNRSASEPQLLLEIMGRHTDWCAMVCLVGGGQEINTGENGVAEWGDALRSLSPEAAAKWWVVCPPQILHGDVTTAGLGIGDLPSQIHVVEEPALRLEVPIRSYRSPRVSEWVGAVVEGNCEQAAQLAEELGDHPIVLTRSLEQARNWLKTQGRGERRFGLLASSGARRLRADGLGVTLNATDGNKIAHWYLNPPEDVRSSFTLEVTANEYTSQGLELDYCGLCWGGDFVWGGDDWEYRQFRGTRWNSVKKPNRQRFIRNSYRVLLTRAREGFVIWIPAGSESDTTRAPGPLNATAAFLHACGAAKLETEDV